MRLSACPFPLTLDIKSSQANGTLMIQSIFSNLTDGLIRTSIHLIGWYIARWWDESFLVATSSKIKLLENLFFSQISSFCPTLFHVHPRLQQDHRWQNQLQCKIQIKLNRLVKVSSSKQILSPSNSGWKFKHLSLSVGWRGRGNRRLWVY